MEARGRSPRTVLVEVEGVGHSSHGASVKSGWQSRGSAAPAGWCCCDDGGSGGRGGEVAEIADSSPSDVVVDAEALGESAAGWAVVLPCWRFSWTRAAAGAAAIEVDGGELGVDGGVVVEGAGKVSALPAEARGVLGGTDAHALVLT
ncbi:hypothetical protein GUJ93_ZPchr0012g21468 [Zizania palustris]|uniref:Uncharacterized protein n=1 Tax=Zizania palustris TaxID=103762 RepID=A0A8J5WRB0_ZIZPA|nr:hypothetical protein GUJ93_ZPchr0012g21468 [Zizania palustris]